MYHTCPNIFLFGRKQKEVNHMPVKKAKKVVKKKTTARKTKTKAKKRK